MLEKETSDSGNSANSEILRELKKIGFSLAIPIKMKNEIIGLCLFGKKRSRDFFSFEDINLLKHLSGEMAFAIDNARMKEKRPFKNRL